MNYQRYGQALKYAAMRDTSDATDTAGILAYQAALGENTPLLMLADLLEEHGHPAAAFLRRAVDPTSGSEEIPRGGTSTDDRKKREREEHWEEAAVHLPTPDWNLARIPYNYPVLPPLDHHGVHYSFGEPARTPRPGRASLIVHYLNHPTGHHFLVEMHGHPEGATSTSQMVNRKIVVPISEDEVRHYADSIREEEPRVHDHILAALTHRQHPVEAAGVVPFAKQFERELIVKYARKAPVPAPPTSTDTAALFRALATTHKHELTNRSGQNDVRGVLADLLEEEGRDGEAAVARSTDPIAIHHGRIWSGNYDSLPASAQEYVRTALGLQPYRGGMMDEYVNPRDLHPDHVARLHADWVTFTAAHEKFPGEIAPHHFHLSRNQDGGGFEDHPEEYGDKRSVKLEAAARQYGIHRLSRPQRQPPQQTI